MPESTLSETFTTLRVRVADYLNLGRTSTAWTTDDTARLNEVILTGYRQFLFPPPLPGERGSHPWSFLRPVTTLATVAGTYAYTLPDSFGALLGPVRYNTQVARPTLDFVSEAMILERRQALTSNAMPLMVALRVLTGANVPGTAGSRWQMIFWPTPDAVYTMVYRYQVLPDAITTTATSAYPYGGMQHADTLLAACLAAAERLIHDERGIHYAEFMERLAASVAMDRALAPDVIAYAPEREFEWSLTDVRRTLTSTYPGHF